MSIFDVEVPEIDKMLNIMESHFENHRYSEAWGLREYWTMEYKNYHKLRPRTVERREKKAINEPKLYELMKALQSKYDELHEDPPPYKEYEHVTFTDPYLFLEFIEAKLNIYGRRMGQAKDTNGGRYISEKELYIGIINGLIYDMHKFFNVFTYDDLFTIDDENIRLKIGELTRLSMKYLGIELITERKEVPQVKGLESLL